MTETELMLLATYRTPVVRLDAISQQHLNLNGENATRAANLNRLPFPAFRMNESGKAPYLVHIKDLAAHIDAQREAATASWANSQT